MEQAINRDERLWVTLCHASAALGYVTFVGFVIGPLIVWLFKKNDYSVVDDQGKEAMNFQISMIIYYIVSAVLTIIFIGIVLLAAVLIFQLVEIIIASVRANNGEMYRYPYTIRFIH